MALQDSGFIAATGSLSSTVAVNMYINVTVVADGTLSVVINNATQVSSVFTAMYGIGSMEVSGVIDMPSGLIQMDASLNADVLETQVLVNTYVTMYGFLSSTVNTYSSIFCSDLNVDFNEQVIESTGCTIGDTSVELKRYRGDTYPVSTKLSKNGNTDVTGSTFQMSTQIEGGTIYTVAGTITNAALGIVEFPLATLAVGTAGSGVYDIQGNDGTYIYTYEKGVFTLLDDVTV